MRRPDEDTVVRVGAIASVGAGVLLIAGFALHAAGEDATQSCEEDLERRNGVDADQPHRVAYRNPVWA